MSGPVLDAIQQVMEEREACYKRQTDLTNELESGQVFGYEKDDHAFDIVALEFKDHPGDGWLPLKERKGFYKPDKRRKAGKAFATRLKSISLVGFKTALEATGAKWIYSGHRLYRPVIGKILGQWIVQIPVDKDHPYEPVKGLRELSLSEWYAMQGEHEQRKEAA